VGTETLQTISNKTFGSNIDAGGFRLTNIGAPVGDDDAVTKTYVDSIASGLDVKESVRVATTVPLASNPSIGSVVYDNTGGTNGKGVFNIVTSSPTVITFDNVSISLSDRILVKDQVSADENGVYIVTSLVGSACTLDRATDFDNTPSTEVSNGAFMFVSEGTVNATSGYILTTTDPVTVGGVSGSDLNFNLFSHAGGGFNVAGAGLASSGNTISISSSTTILSSSSSSNINVRSSSVPNQVLVSTGDINQSMVHATLPITSTSGTLPVSRGGTGATSFTSTRLLQGNGTGAVTAVQVSNNHIASNAAISATKIANGSISNTEFQYLNGVTFSIQEQLDDKFDLFNYANVTVDRDYEVEKFDQFVYVDTRSAAGPVTITLPIIAETGLRILTIVDSGGKSSANNITIRPSGSDQISGASGFLISTDYASVSLCNNKDRDWYIYSSHL